MAAGSTKRPNTSSLLGAHSSPPQDCNTPSSVSSVDIASPISMIPYMSHDEKFCKSFKSSASHIGFSDMEPRCRSCSETGRSCCRPDRTGLSLLSPTSCAAALFRSQLMLPVVVLASSSLSQLGTRLRSKMRWSPLRARVCKDIGGSTYSD